MLRSLLFPFPSPPLFSSAPLSSALSWTNGLTVTSAVAHASSNESTLKTMLDLARQYHKRLEEAEGKSAEELVVLNVGKIDPKKHLENAVEELMTQNITQTLGLMLDTILF